MLSKLFTLLIFSAFLILQGCGREVEEEFTIVVTTSLLGSIAEEVVEDKVRVVTIIPEGMCPGHFDMKPETMKAVSDAEIFLFHGFEEWADELIGSAGRSVERVKIQTGGNLMVPDNYKKAVKEVAGILRQRDPENRNHYIRRSQNHIEKVAEKAAELKFIAGQWEGKTVVASFHQREFLKWLGLEVAAVYSLADDMSPGDWKKVIEKGMEKNAAAVIDNLQSGSRDGIIVARQLNIPHTVLSNFPLEYGYKNTLESNLENLKVVLNENR